MLLQTKNLNSFYGDFQALYNISIELMPGEIIAIIGANGAGKSTLMRSITGLVSKTENEILFKGNIGRIRDIEIQNKTGDIYLLSDDGSLWKMYK